MATDAISFSSPLSDLAQACADTRLEGWRVLHLDVDARIRAIYNNRAPCAALQAARQQKMRAVFATVNSDPGAYIAWQRLLNHLGHNSPFLTVDPVMSFLGPQPGNSFLDALLMLALRHEQWQSAPEAWRSSADSPLRAQFGSLSRHLLSRYPVPPFLDTAWFEGFSPEGWQHQDWFIHIGNGQNIRRATLPLRLTEKAAHHFLQAPDDSSIVAALRRGQTLALGGDTYLADAIAASRLGSILPDEAFWQSVIHWLVNNAQRDTAHVAPIVDFLFAQKFGEPIRPGVGGPLTYHDAPEPGLSMKGRTFAALQRRVEEWHEQLARDARKPRSEWEPCGIAPFHVQEADTHKTLCTWTIVELTNSRALQEEGREMRHCVYTYANACVNGTTGIWSLRIRPEKDVKTRRLLTVEINLARRAIVQVRGHCNQTLGTHRGNGRMRTAGEMLRRWAQEQRLSIVCAL